MKIHYLSNSFIPSRAANSIQVMQMCSAFASLGHEVTLFAGKGEESVIDAFEYYAVPKEFKLVCVPRPTTPIIKSIVYSRNIAKQFFREAEPDLVFARDAASLWMLGRSKSPVVYEAHGEPSAVRRRMERSIFLRDNFVRLVTISSALGNLYYEMFPKSNLRERTIAAHDASIDSIDVPPSDLESNPNGLRVGYIGHLYAGRGIELIIALAERFPQHHFHLVGGTDQHIADYKAKTRELKNTTFHGYVLPSNVAGFRNAMDVLLAPFQRRVAVSGDGDTSRWMSPLKLFEYLSSGKAIIASDLPVLREVLNDEQNCLLAAPDSIEDWSSALDLLADAALRHALGKAARSQYEREHTWKQRAKVVLEGLSLANDPAGSI